MEGLLFFIFIALLAMGSQQEGFFPRFLSIAVNGIIGVFVFLNILVILFMAYLEITEPNLAWGFWDIAAGSVIIVGIWLVYVILKSIYRSYKKEG